MSQPATPLSKIGVVMLGAADLERSISFYRDRLGLELTGKHQGFAFFAAGDISLVLSEPLAKAIDKPPGPVEIVFSVEHVRDAHAALASRGVEFHTQPRSVSGPMWSANFRDTDGHELSIFGQE